MNNELTAKLAGKVEAAMREAARLDPEEVARAFPNTREEAKLLRDAVICRNTQVTSLLFGDDNRGDPVEHIDAVIGIMFNLTAHCGVAGPSRTLHEKIQYISPETIAKVIWHGTLGSSTIGLIARHRGWDWLCSRIAGHALGYITAPDYHIPQFSEIKLRKARS